MLWVKSNSFNLCSNCWFDRLWPCHGHTNWCMSNFPNQSFFCPYNLCPLRVYSILQYSPLQSLIFYFSIFKNGKNFIHSNISYSCNFFKPLLSKFSSNYSWGMVRVVFFGFHFEFWISVRLGGTVKSLKLISSPPDRVFWEGNEFDWWLMAYGLWLMPLLLIFWSLKQ